MEPQMREQQPKKQLTRRRLSWVLWSVVLVVLFAIFAFTVAVLLILKNQGITQGATILTILSIVVGTVVALLGLLFTFLQWFHSRPSNTFEPSTPSAPPAQPTHIIMHVSSSPLPSQLSQSPRIVSSTLSSTSRSSTTPQDQEVTKNVGVSISTANDVHQEDWGEAPYVKHLYGREREIAELKRWIIDDHCQMVILLGMGGIGKTSLAAAVVEQIKNHFTYVFWRPLQNAPPLEHILEKCILFLSNQQHVRLPKEVDDQIALLLECLRNQRCLLILDNVETLLQSSTHAGRYREGYEKYGRLLQRLGESHHQSCLLLTSREKPQEIARLEGNTSPVRSLSLLGVGQLAGRELLQDNDLFGPELAWKTLIQFYSGNPLALRLVAEPIRELFKGDISAFLKGGETLVSNVYDVLAQQFQRLSKFEQEIIYWLAIEREAISLDTLREGLMQQVEKRMLLQALESLRHRSMIETSHPAHFMLQSVVMEYVTNQFIEQVSKEIDQESTDVLASHALIKAHAKDYVRESQVRLILRPIIKQLVTTKGKEETEQKLKSLLSMLRQKPPGRINYAGGNILNILVQLQLDLRGYDFSHLLVREAYLQGVRLSDTNFANTHFERSVFTSTFGSVYSVAWSPDGELLAAGMSTGEIRIWHAASGSSLLICQGHTDLVMSIAFSPDSRMLASGSRDQSIRIWDIITGHCFRIIEAHMSGVMEVAFSPDGTVLASGSYDQSIRIWEVNTGQCIRIIEGHTDGIESVAFSPDGALLASGGQDNTVRIWEVSSGHCLRILDGHIDAICFIAFSPDGMVLASGSNDGTIRIWEVSTDRCLHTLQGHTNWIFSIAFSPDSTMLVSGSQDKTVRIWEVSTGRCLRTIEGHANGVRSIAFTSDSTMLASGSDDGTIWIWEVSTSHCLRILQGHTHWVNSVTFSPDGKILASGSHDRSIRVWEISKGDSIRIMRHSRQIESIAFSPDGETLVSGSDDRSIRMWNVSTGECFHVMEGHTDEICFVTFSPDGTLLANGGDDGTIQLWEIGTSRILYTLQAHFNQVWSVVFDSKGILFASGSQDKTVRIWETSTGQCLHLLRGHTNGVRSVAFSPDGTTLVSGSDDGTIKLWEVSTGRCLRTLQGHTNGVWSVAFNLDGTMLASGSRDGTVKIWNLQMNICLKTLRSSRPYERMNITGVTGLTEVQKRALKVLGAIEG